MFPGSKGRTASGQASSDMGGGATFTSFHLMGTLRGVSEQRHEGARVEVFNHDDSPTGLDTG